MPFCNYTMFQFPFFRFQKQTKKMSKHKPLSFCCSFRLIMLMLCEYKPFQCFKIIIKLSFYHLTISLKTPPRSDFPNELRCNPNQISITPKVCRSGSITIHNNIKMLTRQLLIARLQLC